MSRKRIAAISKRYLRIGPTRPSVAGLPESAEGSLAHRNCANHLNGICGGGLPELPTGLANILFFCARFGGILILTVQT